MSAKDFINRLKIEKSMTTEELSSLIGVKYNTITTILSGDTKSFSKEISSSIINNLGISQEELLYNVYIEKEDCNILSEEALWYICEQEAKGEITIPKYRHINSTNNECEFEYCGLIHKKRSVVYTVVDDWNLIKKSVKTIFKDQLEEIPKEIIIGYALYKLSILSDITVNKYVLIFRDINEMDQVKEIIPKNGVIELKYQTLPDRFKRENLFFASKEEKERFERLYDVMFDDYRINKKELDSRDRECLYKAILKAIPYMDDEKLGYTLFRVSSANDNAYIELYNDNVEALGKQKALTLYLDKLIENKVEFRTDYILLPMYSFITGSPRLTLKQYKEVITELEPLFIEYKIK